MGTLLYRTHRESKTLEIESADNSRYRLVITLQKLGVVSKLDYFLSQEEAEGIKVALSKEHA